MKTPLLCCIFRLFYQNVLMTCFQTKWANVGRGFLVEYCNPATDVNTNVNNHQSGRKYPCQPIPRVCNPGLMVLCISGETSDHPASSANCPLKIFLSADRFCECIRIASIPDQKSFSAWLDDFFPAKLSLHFYADTKIVCELLNSKECRKFRYSFGCDSYIDSDISIHRVEYNISNIYHSRTCPLLPYFWN